MEETVGSNSFNNERKNSVPGKVSKAFICYANLLTFNAPKEIRRHPEFVIINEDKTFSLASDIVIMDNSGKLVRGLIRNTRKFDTTLMLCKENYISPRILISMN